MNETDNVRAEKRRKRVITSARKEQNRVAQRAFRQRQKESRKSLQEANKNRPLRQPELRPRQPCSGETCTPAASPAFIGSVPEVPAVPQLDETPPLAYILEIPETSEPIDPDEIFQATVSTARFIADASSSQAKPRHFPSYGLMGMPLVNFGDLDTAEPDTIRPASHFTDTPLNFEASSLAFDAVPNTRADSSTEPEPRYALLGEPQGLALLPSSTPEEELTSNHPSSDMVSSFDESQIETSVIQYLEDDVPGSSLFLPSTQQLALRNASNRQLSLSNPYANLISPPNTSIITAFVHNARCLRIQRTDLLTNHPRSPFYRPISPSDSTTSLLSSISIPGLPPHLQPTLPQILFPHHAYLDLLPFPVLRARAITWAATTPQIFDPRELKLDIVMGGLICWTERERGGRGMAWDARSWTVAPWFLRKWRLLMG